MKGSHPAIETSSETPQKSGKDFADAALTALKRAAKAARATARAHGTPIYVWKDGKVKALKP